MAMRSMDEKLELDPTTDRTLNDWALSSSLHVGSALEKDAVEESSSTEQYWQPLIHNDGSYERHSK